MRLLDTDHPNILIRLVARAVSMVIYTIGGIVTLLVIIWAYDKFGHHHTLGMVGRGWSWVVAHPKQALSAVVALIIAGPFLADLILGGDNPNRPVYQDNRTYVAPREHHGRDRRRGRRDERHQDK